MRQAGPTGLGPLYPRKAERAKEEAFSLAYSLLHTLFTQIGFASELSTRDFELLRGLQRSDGAMMDPIWNDYNKAFSQNPLLLHEFKLSILWVPSPWAFKDSLACHECSFA